MKRSDWYCQVKKRIQELDILVSGPTGEKSPAGKQEFRARFARDCYKRYGRKNTL